MDKRAVAVSLLSRCAAQISRFRALRQLYRSLLCFAPDGYLVPGDVMLAQKIALETDELATLAVANRLAPVVRRVGPAQSWA